MNSSSVHRLSPELAQRYPTREALAQLEPFGGSSNTASPLDILLARDERVINGLPIQQRSVVKFLEKGKTISEIAFLLDLDRAAVLKIKERAFVRLKRFRVAIAMPTKSLR